LPEANAEGDRARPELVEITLEFASDSMPMLEASGGHDARRCVKFVKVVKRSGLKRFQFLILHLCAT